MTDTCINMTNWLSNWINMAADLVFEFFASLIHDLTLCNPHCYLQGVRKYIKYLDAHGVKHKFSI